jgi:4'-phosphopantetheinyl transferase EntD
MLGPEFAIAVAVPTLVDDQLFPEERLYLARAVPKRRAEFGSARICARRANAEPGVDSGAPAPQP